MSRSPLAGFGRPLPRGGSDAWTGRSPARTPTPALWALLAGATTVVAAVLAGALSSTTLPALLGTSLTRAGADVAGIACVGLALVGVLLPVGAPEANRVCRGPRARRRRRRLAGIALLGIAFRAADATAGRSPR